MSDLALLLPPLAAGLLALLSHMPLGRQVLARGIVFIDLAIAQVTGLGALAAQHLWHGAHGTALTLAATAAALLGAAAVAGLGSAWPERQEALIGLLYVGSASLAVLLVSTDPHGAQKLASLLSGDVLWTTWAALWPLAVVTALFLLALRRWPALMQHDAAFYGSFALLVSLSLPLLGLYLVFVTLIVPALAAQRHPQAARRVALGVGTAGYALGLALSWYGDLPSGPAVVLALIGCGTLAMILRGPRSSASADNGS